MRIILSSIILLSVLLHSCKGGGAEDPTATVSGVKSLLNSGGNKTWSITKYYLNGSLQTLTAGQSRYTKTFKYDNTWIDSDGYSGTYTINNPTSLTEVTSNAGSANRTLNYKINSISTTSLDVEYVEGQNTYRFVYAL